MKIKKLDVITLKDGRTGTVLEVYDDGQTLCVEIADEQGRTLEMLMIPASEIDRITYSA